MILAPIWGTLHFLKTAFFDKNVYLYYYIITLPTNQRKLMKNATFVPSTVHVVATSGLDVTNDLNNNNEHSISTLLNNAYEEKETQQDN